MDSPAYTTLRADLEEGARPDAMPIMTAQCARGRLITHTASNSCLAFATTLILSVALCACGSGPTSAQHAATSSQHPQGGSSASANAGSDWDFLSGVSGQAPDNVWAVGYYTSPNGAGPHATLIERWAGSRWQTVAGATSGSGESNLSGVVALASGNVWAVGDHTPTGSSFPLTLIEHWNGSTWAVVPSPTLGSGGGLSGVAALAPDDLWAVGYYEAPDATDSTTSPRALVEHWDGASWGVVSGPGSDPAGTLSAVTVLGRDNVWAAGTTGSNSTLIEHWDGSSWSIVPSPSPDSSAGQLDELVTSISGLAANDVWMAGSFSAGDVPRALLEHWDGSAWIIMPISTPGSGGDLYGLTALAPNNIWASGDYLDPADPSILHALLEHWDGSSWTAVPSPSPSSSLNILYSVCALAPGDIWAVGNEEAGMSDREPVDIPLHTLVEHWGGSSWTVAPSPDAAS